MNFIINFLIFSLVLGIIVLVHELGHLLAAKAFGVYCHEFSIGMGPAIIKLKKPHWETTYSIRALPLGGYVSMAGEDMPDDALDGVVLEKERTLDGIKPSRRLVIMLSGIVMNFILAFLIFWAMFSVLGTSEVPKPIVHNVQEGLPAEQVGIKPGDEIVKLTFFDGKTLEPNDFNEFMVALLTYEGNELTITVDREGANKDFTLTPDYLENENRYVIGIVGPEIKHLSLSIFEAAQESISHIGSIIQQFFFIIGRLFKGIGLNNIGGPIGIFEVTSEVRNEGFVFFLNLVAMLSVNLGIVNLIPIPVMDGGRAVLTVFEMILGRPLDKKFENAIMTIGMALMLMLFVFIMYNDIRKKF